MNRRDPQIQHCREAIQNLLWAISVLQDDAASEETLAPYRANLKAEHEKLERLLQKGAKLKP